jgi:hypothetical protein
MKQFIAYFGCGYYYTRKNNKAGDFIVTKFEDIIKKIIPFFKEYSLIGAKSLDFVDFCKIATLMGLKKHLTKKGAPLSGEAPPPEAGRL